jgi:cell fate regulator YaaT (PSP1 superfamily)
VTERPADHATEHASENVTGRRHLAQLAPEPPPTGARTRPTPSDDRLDPFLEDLRLLDDEPDGGEAGPPPTDGRTLYLAAGVRFVAARVVECSGADEVYPRGARVVCETDEGLATGEVVVASRRVMLTGTPPRIVRRVSAGDVATEAQLRKREQDVYTAASEAARAAKLPVKVVRAEAAVGGAKFNLYFATDAKVSYRDWLRAIGRASKERVELRQVGMRDAARIIGGVGPCGLQLCCNTFLSDFAPVGIKMAKTQGLTLNPQKVSGMCGRLLCCLVYEEAHYRAGRQLLPGPGDPVGTPRGPGRVRDVDVLQMRVSVDLAGGEVATFPAADVTRRPVE